VGVVSFGGSNQGGLLVACSCVDIHLVLLDEQLDQLEITIVAGSVEGGGFRVSSQILSQEFRLESKHFLDFGHFVPVYVVVEVFVLRCEMCDAFDGSHLRNCSLV
jgi:hypothetical protein